MVRQRCVDHAAIQYGLSSLLVYSKIQPVSERPECTRGEGEGEVTVISYVVAEPLSIVLRLRELQTPKHVLQRCFCWKAIPWSTTSGLWSEPRALRTMLEAPRQVPLRLTIGYCSQGVLPSDLARYGQAPTLSSTCRTRMQFGSGSR